MRTDSSVFQNRYCASARTVSSNSKTTVSYDLYFYKKNDSNLTEEQVANFLTENLPFNISDHPKQWHYENEETGVYFLINWNEKSTAQEDIETFDSFKEFQNLNIDISVNFFRPDYFGLEAFPVIELIINELDLFVLNPQDEENPDTPKKFPAGYFQDQWIRHNDRLSREQQDELNLEYFPRVKSNQAWHFSFNRKKLQDELIEDIFVAGCFFLKSKSDGKIYTMCVWPEYIPIILLPVDYILIQQKHKKLLRTTEKSGLVPYSYVMQELGEYFEDYPNEIPNLKVLRQKDSNQIGRKFNALKIWKTVKEFGEGVGKDGFVNAERQ